MEKMVGYCGLRCDTCPILLATREKDDEKKHEMRVEIAQQIKERYGQDCKAEDVTDCDGCKAKGARLLSGSTNCQIRKCASQKSVENCAHCDKYVCEELANFFEKEPTSRELLDKIRKTL